jgi:hypothetical protein
MEGDVPTDQVGGVPESVRDRAIHRKDCVMAEVSSLQDFLEKLNTAIARGDESAAGQDSEAMAQYVHRELRAVGVVGIELDLLCDLYRPIPTTPRFPAAQE